MGEGTHDDLSSLYEEMAKYDFNKPYSVFIEEFDDDNLNTIPEATNLENRASYQEESVFFQNENINCNKENFNSQHEVTSPSANQYKASSKKLQEPSSLPSFITELLHSKNVQDSITTHHSTNNQPMRRGRPPRGTNKYHQYDQNVNESLKRLSRNLINCLRAYCYYSSIAQQYEINSWQRSDAKKKYRLYINHYFQMSRKIVEREMLPRSHEYAFINDFLKRTTDMAVNQENFTCSFTDVQSMFNALIKWILYPNRGAAQNSEHLQQMVNGVSTSALHMQQVRAGANINYQREYPCPQTCLFSYGSPGFEVRLNISTEVLNDINKQSRLCDNNSNIGNQSGTHQVQTSDILRDLPVATSQQNAAPITQLPLRTTSRDSGFMSPVNDQCIDLENEDINHQPYATYGASQAPNVHHALEGPCELCKTYSTLKCIGCFRVHYCSKECQNMDWSRHQSECKFG